MDNPFIYKGFTFTMLHPTQLPSVFRLIEPGLLEIQRKSKIDWDVMVIPTLVSSNQATLTMIYCKEKYSGFVVTQSTFLGVPSKHYINVIAPYVDIWVSQEGLDGVEAIDAFACELARGMGSKYVMETAKRPGWTRRLERLGYVLCESTMIKEV